MMMSNSFSAVSTNWNNAGLYSTFSRNYGKNSVAALASSWMLGMNMASTPFAFRSSLLSVKGGADALVSSLNFIRGIGGDNRSGSPFHTVKASTNSDVLEMRASTMSKSLTNNAYKGNFKVDIQQLATTQKNEGIALSSSALASSAGFTVGLNRITINTNGSQYDFNFNISATDTNRDVQERIASAVNNRNIGINAFVNIDASGNSRLSFESEKTGVYITGQPNFTIVDTIGSSIAAGGGGSITQQAQNAQFRVYRGFTGAWQTSKTNDVNLGYGLTATLKKTGTASITMGQDTDSQISAFKDMANAYNDLLHAGSSGSRLAWDLTKAVKTHSVALNRLGITVGKNGYMQIDENRMRQAIERGNVNSYMKNDQIGISYGFFNDLTRAANAVSRNPQKYLTDDRFFNNRMFNPRLINHIWGTGMLFDIMM